MLRVSRLPWVRGQRGSSASEGDLDGAAIWNSVAGDLSQCVRDGRKYGPRVSTSVYWNEVSAETLGSRSGSVCLGPCSEIDPCSQVNIAKGMA